MAPGTLPKKSVGKSVDFFICHNKNNPTKFHFHEFTGTRPNRHTCGKNCVAGICLNSIGPIELAMKGARAKVIQDSDSFSKLKPILVEHRGLIEKEMVRKSQKKRPPPHSVMQQLLDQAIETPSPPR